MLLTNRIIDIFNSENETDDFYRPMSLFKAGLLLLKSRGQLEFSTEAGSEEEIEKAKDLIDSSFKPGELALSSMREIYLRTGTEDKLTQLKVLEELKNSLREHFPYKPRHV